MIKRLHIQNYMAHKDTTLELGPGVTVLTGPNNSGKSAVVEAIRSLAMNPVPHHVIRHGASKAVVRAELDSGEVVEWVRTRGNTVYNLYRNDEGGEPAGGSKEPYAKFGRTPPDDIRGVLRLDPVETETGPVDIHIGNQRYPVFLLDQTGSQAAGFFAASTEAEYLLRIQQALKTRTDRAKSKRKDLLLENEGLAEILECFLPLDGIDQDLSAAEKLHESLKKLQASIPVLEQTALTLDAVTRNHAHASACGGVLGALSGPPDLLETAVLERTLEEMTGAGLNLASLVDSVAALHPLAPPPVTEDTAGLAGILGSLKLTLDAHGRQSLAEASLQVLESPPQLQDAARLLAILDVMDRGTRTLESASKAGLVLSATADPPPTHDTGALQKSIGAMSEILAAMNLCQSLGIELNRLRAPGEPNLLEPVSSLIRTLEETEFRLWEVGARAAELGSLRACPDLVAVAPLEGILESMTRFHTAAQEVDRELNAVVRALDLKLQEVEARVAEAGICPLCGHAMDVEHFVEGLHA